MIRRLTVRTGFTLLEVLVALSLSMILLLAVYAALDLHWQYSNAGQDEVLEAQIVRSVFNKLELDVRSLVFREPEPTAEEPAPTTSGTGTGDGTGDGDSTTVEVTTNEIIDSTEAGLMESSGLFGSSEKLLLHVNQPSRSLEYAFPTDASVTGQRSSDLQSVSWFVAQSGSTGLAGAVSSKGTGLARSAGDRFATDFADENSNMYALVEQSEVLAPEVSAIRFAYYDGATWQAAWDSTEMASLPRAIEVQIDVTRVRANRGPGRTATKDQQPETHTYKLIILVPLAKRVPTV